MSSRATSVRPPYITIRSSRARANSYIPPLHSPAVEDFDLLPTDDPAGCSPVVETTEHTTPFRSALDYLSSFFVHRSTEHMYSLSHSASSSVDSLSLPLPASPQQASFGAEVWQEDGHFRIGGRPTTKETVPWWSGGVSVRNKGNFMLCTNSSSIGVFPNVTHSSAIPLINHARYWGVVFLAYSIIFSADTGGSRRAG